MRSMMMFATIITVSGTYMAQFADELSSAVPAQTKAAQESASAKSLQEKFMNVFVSQPEKAQPNTVQASVRSVIVPRDQRGHFQTDGQIDGQRINFMVDTGASVIALNERSAARIGVRPSRGDYTTTVKTANGSVKAAHTRLAMVEVGGLIVRDVDALVLPDEALSENLLGLSFLSKLRRYEFTGSKLVMEQ